MFILSSSLVISFSLVVVGVSAAMNELRPCAPISLKHLLAQELIKGLRAVSDSLLRYNTARMLRESESGLFLALCRAFIEVLFLLTGLIVICNLCILIILTSPHSLMNPLFTGCLPTLCHMLWSLLPWWSCSYHGRKELI